MEVSLRVLAMDCWVRVSHTDIAGYCNLLENYRSRYFCCGTVSCDRIYESASQLPVLVVLCVSLISEFSHNSAISHILRTNPTEQKVTEKGLKKDRQ